MFSICQSISFLFIAFKILFASAKCPQPKNPREAERGLGCGASRMKCCGARIISRFLRAFAPQSRKIIGSGRSFKSSQTRSVKISQPLFW